MTRKEETAMRKTLRDNATELEWLRAYNLKLLTEAYELWQHNGMLKACLDTVTTFKKANDV